MQGNVNVSYISNSAHVLFFLQKVNNTQTNTNSVKKTWVTLKTTVGKNGPNVLFIWKP